MRWTPRQQTLLEAMGLRLWLPPASGAAAEPLAAAEPPQARPAAPAAVDSMASAPPVPAKAAPAPAPAAAAAAAAPATRTAAATPAAPPAPLSAAAAAVATMDWPALREVVAGCRDCGLCASRRQTVFGVGHPQAHLMVVGEAPGEQEDQRGEPFVGAAGQLLDRMLAALGLTRDEAPAERQVFIANTLKCRPPRNRNPSPEELASCRPYLERQVALVQPRVILAMGRFAVQSLLGSDAPIGRLRGQVHHWQGVPLVVTYHPAYLLRQPTDKARAWDDLCLAASLLDGAPAAAAANG